MINILDICNIDIDPMIPAFTSTSIETIKYLVGHSNFNGVEIRNLIKSIKSKSYSDEMQEVLAKFILANHITEGTSVLNAFTRQISFLTSHGYEVSEEMMDKKNFNSIKNLDYIENVVGYAKSGRGY